VRLDEPEAIANMLPEEITLATPLASTGKSRPGKETVGDKLKELGAYVRQGKLYDVSGKEIRFFIWRGKRTFSDKEHIEWMRWQAQKEQRLKQRYTVVVIFEGR
jgi:hypothetical protein